MDIKKFLFGSGKSFTYLLKRRIATNTHTMERLYLLMTSEKETGKFCTYPNIWYDITASEDSLTISLRSFLKALNKVSERT